MVGLLVLQHQTNRKIRDFVIFMSWNVSISQVLRTERPQVQRRAKATSLNRCLVRLTICQTCVFVTHSGLHNLFQETSSTGNQARVCRDGNAIASGHPWLVTSLIQGQTWRFNMSCLISPMAFAGFSPLGQALVQFIIVWQR